MRWRCLDTQAIRLLIALSTTRPLWLLASFLIIPYALFLPHDCRRSGRSILHAILPRESIGDIRTAATSELLPKPWIQSTSRSDEIKSVGDSIRDRRRREGEEGLAGGGGLGGGRGQDRAREADADVLNSYLSPDGTGANVLAWIPPPSHPSSSFFSSK
jgi:hypothetical protein